MEENHANTLLADIKTEEEDTAMEMQIENISDAEEDPQQGQSKQTKKTKKAKSPLKIRA